MNTATRSPVGELAPSTPAETVRSAPVSADDRRFRCPLCTGREGAAIGRNPDFPESTLAWCRGCGLIGTFPLPGEERLFEVYREHYRRLRREEPTPDYLEDCDRRAEAQLLFATTYAKPKLHSPHVLDVGCSSGSFLKLCSRFSGSLMGFEPDHTMRAVALQRLPPTAVVYETLFRPDRLCGQRFDWIVVSHVLEHVRDPVSFLRDLLAGLTAGGVLLLEVPNEDRETVRGWVRSGRQGRLHLYGFDAVTLARAVEAAGGRLLHSATFGEPQGGAASSARVLEGKQKLRQSLQASLPGPLFDGLRRLREKSRRRRRRRMTFIEQGSTGECLRALILRANR